VLGTRIRHLALALRPRSGVAPEPLDP
jgi:hypothetical protein